MKIRNLNGNQLGNYAIHGMLIAQLFAIIFIQLQQSNPKFECEISDAATVVCSADWAAYLCRAWQKS